jgi:hypothetical protein
VFIWYDVGNPESGQKIAKAGRKPPKNGDKRLESRLKAID